ncbi:MAG: ribonuclease III [Bacteroidales bacterium]|nr:ribonuclease III [Bacteroidales bacterium]
MKNRRFYLDLVRLLGFLPRHISLYKLALIPRSALQKNPSGNHLNNERLEYLGDAVLDAIVADHLFQRFPQGDEGFMTKLRARIVKRKNLDYLAIKIGIPAMINPGVNTGSKSKHTYGNALEAIIGAIYLDRGYRAARKFFERKIMKRHIDLVQLVKKDPDYKSRIIEWSQKNRMEIIFDSKEEHIDGRKSPSFVSTVHINAEEKGTGRGDSKKEAEQQASKIALKSIHTLL